MFTAEEQKFWFETLRFHFNATAVRCRRCRRRRRTGRALNHQLSSAVRLVQERPDDPVAHVTLARATAELFAHAGTGNLERGIAAAHRARRLAPSLHDALYWAAVLQEHAGRADKATRLYDEFVASVRGRKRYRTMVDAALRRTTES